MKISIVMPTYNDCESIVETLNSVLIQTYKDWELIIMDDGSTDETKDIIGRYIENNKCSGKIYYYYQENQDQLNAIKNSIKYITGSYIFILHSDDLLPDKNFLERLTNEVKENPEIDVFIGDLNTIDEKGNNIGSIKVRKYSKSKKILPLLMLWLGRNLYVDVIFSKKEVFEKQIVNSYLNWNMPFWVAITEDINMLNVKNVDFPMLNYRLHQNNYINNELGKLNVINGELRTITRLMKFYNIPNYKLQFYIYRIFNKLKLSSIFYPIYLNKEQNNKYKIIEFVIRKRFNEDYKSNIFLNNLIEYYKNYNNRSIYIDKINHDEVIYKGKDIRTFNKNLLNNKLTKLYIDIITEMKYGFNEIIVDNEEDKYKIINITKFLCIYPYVKVSVKSNEEKGV